MIIGSYDKGKKYKAAEDLLSGRQVVYAKKNEPITIVRPSDEANVMAIVKNTKGEVFSVHRDKLNEA